MNQVLSILNFLGVCALAVLCAEQWTMNSRLENNVVQLEKTRIEQANQIDEQARTIKDDAADLADLRDRLSMSEMQLEKITADRDRLAAEDTQLKMAVDQWTAAVKQRDTALKHANDLIQSLANQRNDAIQKFNDLADKYNALVKQVESSQGK